MWEKIEKMNLGCKILFVPITILTIGILGYLLLVGVYLLPTNQMKIHMEETSIVFEEEGTYPRVMNGKEHMLDNFTDAWMLQIASYPNKGDLFSSAINAKSYRAKDKNPVDTILYMFRDQGEEELYTIEYSRYWHGYLIFLKPLLLVANYEQIRNILMVTQLALFFILMIKLSQVDFKLCIPLFVTYCFVNPATTMLSLQFNTLIMLSLIAMNVVLGGSCKWKHGNLYGWSIVFLCIGAFTSYFDLLTYPVISLGLPLVLWVSLNYSERIVENIKNVITISSFWGIGYAGLWSFKWILGSLITGDNIIENAINQFFVRTSATVSETLITYQMVLEAQLKNVSGITIILVLLVLGAYIVLNKNEYVKVRFDYIAIMILIGSIPFAWYFVLKNHSYVHGWFTYRGIAISIYSILNGILLNYKRKNKVYEIHS